MFVSTNEQGIILDVTNLLNKANRRTTVGMAAVLLSGSYILSRILGLLRDRLLASHFGVGELTDAYTAAFRLPDLLFTLLVSGALAVAFIPILAEHLERKERDEAWQVSSALLNILALGTVVVCAVAWIFADPLTTLITPGFDPERHKLTVDLTRIMLIPPVLFVISSVFGSIQQAVGRFLFFSLAGVLYNLGIIFGIVFLSGQYSIYGVAWGVVIGTVLQALLQITGCVGLGFRYSFSFNLWHPSVIKTLKLMGPRSLDQGIDQIHYTIETIIGSKLVAGSLTAYYYANNLKNVPLAIFGTAIATAAFPRLAARASAGNKEGLIEDFVKSFRMIVFLLLPSAALAVVLRGYIVRLLFGFGDATTANTLGWFAGSIIFGGLFFLVARMYYALQDTKTPLLISLLAIGLNTILSLVLSQAYGVIGLSASQSIIAILETLILMAILQRRLGNVGLRSIWKGAVRMIIATSIMASAVYISVARLLPLYADDRGFMIIAPKFAALLAIAIFTYLLPCYILDLNEARKFMRRITQSITKTLSLRD